MKRLHLSRVSVHRTGFGQNPAWAILRLGPVTLSCRIGRTGVIADKREGDGATPRGTLRAIRGFWRADRRLPPRSLLPLRPVRAEDGWCDAPGHGAYNRLVRLPFAPSHETMMRSDRAYDVVVELDWNHRPRRQGRGSAIFLHLTKPERKGTAGCIAVDPRHIALVMARIGPKTRIVIT